jgi:hypothetical protein
MKSFNSPYGVIDHGDVQILPQALPQENVYHTRMKSMRNGNEICMWCFYGIHPHEPRTKATENGGFTDSQDCKVILTDDSGKSSGQCCCTWYLEENTCYITMNGKTTEKGV